MAWGIGKERWGSSGKNVPHIARKATPEGLEHRATPILDDSGVGDSVSAPHSPRAGGGIRRNDRRVRVTENARSERKMLDAQKSRAPVASSFGLNALENMGYTWARSCGYTILDPDNKALKL